MAFQRHDRCRGPDGRAGLCRTARRCSPTGALVVVCPAVEKNELAREIAAMRAGGFGGFEIQPVYPLAIDDPAMGIRNLKFLSDEFLADVRFAADTARAQGMRADITLGSGWPFGGPYIPMTEASSQIHLLTIAVHAGVRRAALPPVGEGERFVGGVPSPKARRQKKIRQRLNPWPSGPAPRRFCLRPLVASACCSSFCRAAPASRSNVQQ